MALSSKIEWTEATWNPVTGCTPISDGCKNCYARRMALRLQRMGNKRYSNGFQITLHYDLLSHPLKWKSPKMIFVNSMSDLFHEDVPIAFIKTIFKTIKNAHWHTFQVLTKRAKRLSDLSSELEWPKNLWIGVTIESGKYSFRADLLRKVPAHVRFISFEPLIGPVNDIDFTGINWAIVGGESGPGCRIIKKEWVKEILSICRRQNVHFFFKQWGGVNKKKTGRILDGKIYDEMPPILSQGEKEKIFNKLQQPETTPLNY